jgi:hypothetical protein
LQHYLEKYVFKGATGKLCLARGTYRVTVIKYLNLLALTLHFVPIFDIRILRLLFFSPRAKLDYTIPFCGIGED